MRLEMNGALLLGALLATTFACGDDGGKSGADAAGDAQRGDAPGPPTPWIYPADAAGEAPALDDAQRQAAIRAALDALLELDPDAIATLYEPTAGKSLTFDGGISGLEGFPADISAVSFDGLTFRSKAAGASCAREPGGAVSVRGPDGSWYDVLFDGPTDDAPETDAATCDGCGATWFRGGEVGGTCLEAAGYLAWEGAPW